MPSHRSGERQSAARLRELQRLTAIAILRPLDRNQRMQRCWTDGRPTGQVVSEFIRPNDRLNSLERLEIYNRQYWFRVLDCLYDDYPGLRAILGDRKFYKLRVAYLTKYPSTSFTLRNLGSRLEQFISEEPHWAHPHEAISRDMARFEWAQIVAFDSEARPPLTVNELLGKNPARLRLGLQPYLTLLELKYPLDEFVLAVKKRSAALRSEASNAVEDQASDRASRRVRLPRPRQTFLAVHRFENDLYYKRLGASQYKLLAAIRDGASLQESCELVTSESDEQFRS